MTFWMRKAEETLDTVANNTNSKIIYTSFYDYLEKFHILILPRSKKLKSSAPIWLFFFIFQKFRKISNIETRPSILKIFTSATSFIIQTAEMEMKDRYSRDASFECTTCDISRLLSTFWLEGTSRLNKGQSIARIGRRWRTFVSSSTISILRLCERIIEQVECFLSGYLRFIIPNLPIF